MDNAGKTTLLERIKTHYGNSQGLAPEKIPPTIGMNRKLFILSCIAFISLLSNVFNTCKNSKISSIVAKIKYKGSQVVFWDLGGQNKMRKVWESYYLEANAVVFVVDSADPTRFNDVREAFSE